MLKSILRAKTAEALVMAPARLLPVEVGEGSLRSPRSETLPADVSEHVIVGDLGRSDEHLDKFNWLSRPSRQIF